MSSKSRSLISNTASSCKRLSTSKPRRPRVRLSGSTESEIACSSRKTKRGTISAPSEKAALDDLDDSSVDDRRRIDDLWQRRPRGLPTAPRGTGTMRIFAPMRAPRYAAKIATMRYRTIAM